MIVSQLSDSNHRQQDTNRSEHQARAKSRRAPPGVTHKHRHRDCVTKAG